MIMILVVTTSSKRSGKDNRLGVANAPKDEVLVDIIRDFGALRAWVQVGQGFSWRS